MEDRGYPSICSIYRSHQVFGLPFRGIWISITVNSNRISTHRAAFVFAKVKSPYGISVIRCLENSKKWRTRGLGLIKKTITVLTMLCWHIYIYIIWSLLGGIYALFIKDDRIPFSCVFCFLDLVLYIGFTEGLNILSAVRKF